MSPPAVSAHQYLVNVLLYAVNISICNQHLNSYNQNANRLCFSVKHSLNGYCMTAVGLYYEPEL